MTLGKAMRIALLCSVAGIFAVPASGTSVSPSEAKLLGTSRAHVTKSARVAQETIRAKAFRTYPQAGYATGGVSLRNREGGVIHISGMNGVVRAGWLYWAYLFAPGVAPPATQPITMQRLFPTGVAPFTKILKGTLIATGGDPCWGSAGTAVYRASVPTNLATGNGYYRITLDPAAIGLTTGEDPWDGNVKFPLAEGASLALIGDGVSNVSIFDKGMSGIEFSAPIAYSLTLPLALTGNPVLFDAFGADGQIGSSRRAGPEASETVTINGTQISGTGGLDPDSDWNGSSGFPLPQLWDDTGHDISPSFATGGGAVNVSIVPNGDCLVTIANVISY
jgi:hypothetical protein